MINVICKPKRHDHPQKTQTKTYVVKLSLLCFATSKIQTLFLHKQTASSHPFIFSFKGSNVISVSCFLWKRSKHMAFKSCFQTTPVLTKPSRGRVKEERYSVTSWYLGVCPHYKYAQIDYAGCLGPADHIFRSQVRIFVILSLSEIIY